MCGLVGVANFTGSGIGSQEAEMFENLLIAGAVRGVDGTGMFMVNEDGKIQTLKKTGEPFWVILNSNYGKLVDYINKPYPKILAGHNRYATKGGTKDKHTHPFTHGHITLMHNGTLSSHKFTKDFDVDSEALCYAIMEMGIDDAVAKMHGAFALCYYNHREKSLNLARNNQRPLFVATGKYVETIAWASEKELLTWVLTRNRLVGQFEEPYEIEPHLLLSFTMGDKFKKETRKISFTGSQMPTYSYTHSPRYNGNPAIYNEDYWHQSFGPRDAWEESEGVLLRRSIGQLPKNTNNVIALGDANKDVNDKKRYRMLQSIKTKDGKFEYKRGDLVPFRPDNVTPIGDTGKARFDGKSNMLEEETIISSNMKIESAWALFETPILLGRVCNICVQKSDKDVTTIWIDQVEVPPQSEASKTVN